MGFFQFHQTRHGCCSARLVRLPPLRNRYTGGLTGGNRVFSIYSDISMRKIAWVSSNRPKIWPILFSPPCWPQHQETAHRLIIRSLIPARACRMALETAAMASGWPPRFRPNDLPYVAAVLVRLRAFFQQGFRPTADHLSDMLGGHIFFKIPEDDTASLAAVNSVPALAP